MVTACVCVCSSPASQNVGEPERPQLLAYPIQFSAHSIQTHHCRVDRDPDLRVHRTPACEEPDPNVRQFARKRATRTRTPFPVSPLKLIAWRRDAGDNGHRQRAVGLRCATRHLHTCFRNAVP